MLSDDAPETGGGRGSWEKKRKGGEKKKKSGEWFRRRGSSPGGKERWRWGVDVCVWRGMTNGFFVARHLPVGPEKQPLFPSKPGSKATGFPFDLLPRYVRKEARHLSFQTGGHEARRFSTPSKWCIEEILSCRYFRVQRGCPPFISTRSRVNYFDWDSYIRRALKCRFFF